MSTNDRCTELKRVYREVRRAACKRGHVGIHDYEDIAQEAMVRYLNKPGGAFAPHKWIFLAVKSVTFDLCRKRYRELKVIEQFRDDDAMAYSWTQAEMSQAVCESTIEEKLDRTYLEIALIALLGEGTFEILKLYADGYSYSEIAEKMSIKIGTVRSRIHYAKVKAKTMLEA